jgi:hypothetical protein
MLFYAHYLHQRSRCCSYEMCFPRNICLARAIKEGTQYLDAKTVTRRTLKLSTSYSVHWCSRTVIEPSDGLILCLECLRVMV